MTIGPNARKLLDTASAPLSDAAFASRASNRLAQELDEILAEKNGFYAFESALLVRSHEAIVAWNEHGLWREGYSGLANGILFFAEDAFGGQFGIQDDRVVSFDPETGDTEALASSVDGWAARLLDDYPVLTGYPLAAEWQQEHGRLAPGVRLFPKIPFVAGGDFSVRNLYELDDVTGMRLRGDIARQIHDAPDGAELKCNIVD